MRPQGGSGLLVALAVVIGFTYYGPQLAQRFASSAAQVIATLTPIVGPLLAVALAVLIWRHYWSRW